MHLREILKKEGTQKVSTEIDNVLLIDITLAKGAIQNAKTPLEALRILMTFDEWWDGSRPREARFWAWCMWLKERGYNDWVSYLKLIIRAFNALSRGNLEEAKYYTDRLKETPKPEGWVDNWKDYISGHRRMKK